MKRIILLFCVSLLAFGNVSAQQIRSAEPDVTDAIWALKATGYELFSFDLSELKDTTYEVQIFLTEVDSTGTKENMRIVMGPTRMSRFGLYVIPENDSVVLANFRLNEGYGGNLLLKLRPLPKDPQSYRYTSRPFKLDGFTAGVDTPLMLYGSAWYDEKSKVHRFCGENEIDPDMSTEILKYIPHYYIIGIRLTETD